MLEENTLKGLEIWVLIALIVVSYIVGYFIQVREYNVKFDIWEFIIGLISSFIFSTITYFIVFKWINIGVRIGATVLSSLRAYSVMKYIFSKDGENVFVKIFKKKILKENGDN